MKDSVYYKGADGQRHDPFNGLFDAAREELSKVLSRSFTGSLSEAMHVGNSAMIAFRILDGTYDVTESSFKIQTEDAR